MSSDSNLGDDLEYSNCTYTKNHYLSDGEEGLAAMMHKKIDTKLREWEDNDQLTPENLKLALKTYNNLLEMDHEDMNALLGKAYVEGLMGNPQGAIETLEIAKELEPNNGTVIEMLREAQILKEELSDLHIGYDGLCDLLIQVLGEVFDRFAVNNGLGPEELRSFYRTTNEGFIGPEMLDMLLSGKYKTDSNGRLTKEGFLEFYYYQTLEFPEETQRDLERLGYAIDLTKIQ